jgi:glutaredoxin 3
MSASVRVYSAVYCSYCHRAKELLRRKGVEFEDVDVTYDAEARRWLVETTGRRTVPQIFIGERSIGGFDELSELDAAGELDRLLASEKKDGTADEGG